MLVIPRSEATPLRPGALRSRARAARSSSRFAGAASPCGTATTTTSLRAESLPASGTPTISSSGGTPCGTRGATTRSATARSSRSSTASSGPSHAVAAVVDSLTGAALAVVTWLLAREGLSPWRARVAGLIVALHPGLILYAALVMTEPLAALLTLLAFWLAVRDCEARARTRASARSSSESRRSSGRRRCLCVPFLALLVTPKPSVRALGALVPVCALALAPRPPLDGAQLPGDGRLRPRQHERRMEPRHRRVPSGDRSFRDASLLRRLPRGHRAGPAGPLLVRLRPTRESPTTRCTGSRSPRRSSATRSITSPSRSNTSTRRAPTTGPSGAARSGAR